MRESGADRKDGHASRGAHGDGSGNGNGVPAAGISPLLPREPEAAAQPDTRRPGAAIADAVLIEALLAEPPERVLAMCTAESSQPGLDGHARFLCRRVATDAAERLYPRLVFEGLLAPRASVLEIAEARLRDGADADRKRRGLLALLALWGGRDELLDRGPSGPDAGGLLSRVLRAQAGSRHTLDSLLARPTRATGDALPACYGGGAPIGKGPLTAPVGDPLPARTPLGTDPWLPLGEMAAPHSRALWRWPCPPARDDDAVAYLRSRDFARLARNELNARADAALLAWQPETPPMAWDALDYHYDVLLMALIDPDAWVRSPPAIELYARVIPGSERFARARPRSLPP